MFKEMTTKTKIIIAVIVVVLIVSIILFLRSRKKKKQAQAQLTEQPIQTTAPVIEKVERRSQIVPEEDLQSAKSAPEKKLSVEEVIPVKEQPAATTPQVNNGNMKEGKPAVMQTKASALPPEFMINANNPNA